MARRRYVSTTISQDTRVNKLAIQYGDFAALLYTWMIPHAADDASLPGDPEELLYQVLPGRRDKTEDDVRRALDGMAALGLVVATGDGRIMFPPTAFYKYQTYIKERNKHGVDDAPPAPQNSATPPPAPTKQTDSAKQRKTAQNASSFSPSLSFSPSVTKNVSHETLAADKPPRPTATPRPLRSVPKPKDEPVRDNPIWDALVAGIGVTPQTPDERSRYGKAVKDLKAIDAAPDDVLRRCENYRLRWPDLDLTTEALLKHWSLMERPPPARAVRGNGGGRETTEEYNRRTEREALGDESADIPGAIDVAWRVDQQETHPRRAEILVDPVRRSAR